MSASICSLLVGVHKHSQKSHSNNGALHCIVVAIAVGVADADTNCKVCHDSCPRGFAVMIHGGGAQKPTTETAKAADGPGPCH